MTKVYRIYPMVFDVQRWKDVMRSIGPNDTAVFAEVIGVTRSTLSAWRNLNPDTQFAYPSMTAFIAACNALDLNPQDFFVLGA